MAVYQKKDSKGLFGGICMAHVILLLHVVLIALVGCLVLFFRGVTSYLPWIFLAGSALIGGGAWAVLRRLRAEGRSLRDLLRTPLFGGRNVEISVLGGLASLRLGNDAQTGSSWQANPPVTPLQLESPASARLRELSELARLLENDFITREEYNQTKQQLFKSH
jgi:hypothetical protein